MGGGEGNSPSTHRPLTIAIVGAGIGGLTAALELRRNGHKVTLFEQSRLSAEYGAAIHMAPNANGLLTRLGLDIAKAGGIPTEVIREGARDGTIVKTIPIGLGKAMWQHGALFCHRSTLHNCLKQAVLSEDGAGTPVTLRTSSKVESVSEEGEIVLGSGERLTADVIVGADGVHSKVRTVLHPEAKVMGSGKNAYRFLLEKEALRRAAPDAYELVKDDGTLTQFYDVDRRVVVFPADHNEWLNLVCMHPESLSDGSGEEWSREGDRDRMMEIYKDFGPQVRAILGQAPRDSLKVWKLLDMSPLPSWTGGRVCLLGDAAHPFLPYNGQGGACAIEDAAALGVMLQLGTTAGDVPERLRLYEKARKERADTLQEYSRAAGHDLKPDAMDEAGKVMAKLAAFAYGHDEHHNSTHILRQHLLGNNRNHSSSSGPDGFIWRSPVGFGPMPGPRQTFDGEVPDSRSTPFRSVAVRMKTSRTLLQNLLPRRDVLSFHSPGTVAEMTWKYQRNERVAWLGHRPYAHFSLYLHGVACTKPDGSGVLVGDYLALMLEDRADPVVTGRDELGFPKLWCELADSVIAADSSAETPLSTQIRAGWMGHNFVTLSVSDAALKKPTNRTEEAGKKAKAGGWGAKAPPHAGTLVHRYVPAVGKREEADADYIVCVPPLEGEEKPMIEKVWTSEKAHVTFDAGNWEKLPTLHHIVDRLQELPVLGVVEATITEGKGASDHKHIYRVF